MIVADAPGASRTDQVSTEPSMVGASAVAASPSIETVALPGTNDAPDGSGTVTSADRVRLPSMVTVAAKVAAGTVPPGSAATSTSANSIPPSAREFGSSRANKQVGEGVVVEEGLEAERPEQRGEVEVAGLAEHFLRQVGEGEVTEVPVVGEVGQRVVRDRQFGAERSLELGDADEAENRLDRLDGDGGAVGAPSSVEEVRQSEIAQRVEVGDREIEGLDRSDQVGFDAFERLAGARVDDRPDHIGEGHGIQAISEIAELHVDERLQTSRQITQV